MSDPLAIFQSYEPNDRKRAILARARNLINAAIAISTRCTYDRLMEEYMQRWFSGDTIPSADLATIDTINITWRYLNAARAEVLRCYADASLTVDDYNPPSNVVSDYATGYTRPTMWARRPWEAADDATNARLDAILSGANSGLDQFIEVYNRFLSDESMAAALNTALSNEVAARQSADTTNATAISNEATTRASADTTETNARIASDSANTSAISAEATTRAAADATEASSRTAGDSATLTSAKAYSDAGDSAEASARAGADTTLQTNVNGKFTTPTGTTAQYLRGDGSLATFPAIPAAQIQSDYTQASTGSVDYIKNKPTLGTAAAQNTSAFDAAGAASTAQAFAIQRANHTGTQLSATISDFTSAARGSISLTTTGTSGAATYTAGVLNVPNYANSGGTVTSVSGTSPVVSSGGNTPVISMAAATGSVNGYLTAADWTTFSAKQSALTFSTPLVNTSGTVSVNTGTTAAAGVLQLATTNGTSPGTAAAGSSGKAADSGHVHPLPANATASVDGLMSASDKSKLDSLTLVGGFPVESITTVSANYTVTNADEVIRVTATATITLPTAVGIAGKRFRVKSLTNSTVTIATTSSQTIDGATTQKITSQYGTFNIMSNGTNYDVV